MASLTKEQATSRERTLLTALLLSAPGPLLTGIAAFSSQSTTQFADFVRRSAELVALFLSWWVFRQIQRSMALDASEEARLERIAGLSVAGAMLLSGAVMMVLALSRLSTFEPGGNVSMGLTIAVLGFITNVWFWRRYSRMTREQYNPVIAAQQHLYRAKASVDLCVVAALAAVAVAPTHPVTPYIDVLGSIAVAIYLLWSGLRTGREHFGQAE